MKCENCKQNIKETFLKKLVGTYVRRNGKRVALCGNCQSQESKT
jgi:hypothetical protein